MRLGRGGAVRAQQCEGLSVRELVHKACVPHSRPAVGGSLALWSTACVLLNRMTNSPEPQGRPLYNGVVTVPLSQGCSERTSCVRSALAGCPGRWKDPVNVANQW